MLRPGAQDLSPSTQHHPAKPCPVFVVPINHDGDHRVAPDVADALECWSSHALRLLADGDVKPCEIVKHTGTTCGMARQLRSNYGGLAVKRTSTRDAISLGAASLVSRATICSGNTGT